MDAQSTRAVACLAIPALTIGTDFTGALMLVTPIEQDFGVDITTTQWVLNIYALTFAMGMVAGGRLGDMHGRRRLLLIGLTIFVIASLACALAPSILWLIVARGVQGVGAALTWPSVLAAASLAVRADERGFAMGLILGAVTFGNVIGPVISGLAGGLGDWRAFYIINLVLGALSFVLILFILPKEEHKPSQEKVDYLGIVVLALAIFALLYALDVGAEWGWTSGGILGLLLAAVVLFAAFPMIEPKVKDPLVPPPMMRNKHFLLALSANGLIVPAVFLMFLYLPQYLNKVLGWSVLMSSVGTLPLMACLTLMTVSTGRVYNRFGPRKLLTTGYSVAAIGCLSVLFVEPSWGYIGLVPVMLLIGIGSGTAVSSAGSAAVGAADPSRAGLAGALSFMVHLALGAIGVAAGTALLFSGSGATLTTGLKDLGVKLSAEEIDVLNGAAAHAESSHAILERFPPEVHAKISALSGQAFTSGLHQAYWLALILCLLGVVACFCLKDEELSGVDS